METKPRTRSDALEVEARASPHARAAAGPRARANGDDSEDHGQPQQRADAGVLQGEGGRGAAGELLDNPRPRGAGPSLRGRPARSASARATPLHPGQFLERRFLRPRGITQTDLALAMGVSRRRVNELINGRRGITPDTAMRLAMYFGNDAALWMHLQVAWDMHNALEAMRSLGANEALVPKS
jgi:addiction module HigA family antidote